MARRRRADAGDDFARLFQGLTPGGVDVGVLAGDLDRLFRRAAEEDRQVVGLDRREGALQRIERAVVVERLLRRPFPADDLEIFVGSGITLRLDGVIAVARHFLIGAAGDDVDGDAAAAQLVQRRQLARRQGRLGEARAVCDQEAELRGDCRGVGRHDLAFRRIGAEGDQDAVEIARFLPPGRRLDIGAIKPACTLGPAGQDIAVRALGFGRIVEADITDEFDAHGRLLK